jgi:hypothetical protein
MAHQNTLLKNVITNKMEGGQGIIMTLKPYPLRVDLKEQLIYLHGPDKILWFQHHAKPNFHGYNNVGQRLKMNHVMIKTILSYPLSHYYDYINILHDNVLILVMVTIT